MSSTVLAAQVRARLWLRTVVDRVRESEFGQGAAEYAGIVVVALAIVAVIAGVLTPRGPRLHVTLPAPPPYEQTVDIEAPRCPRRQLMRDHDGPVLGDGRRRRGGHQTQEQGAAQEQRR